VLTAMLELHTGVEADEAPTRIRDVVTDLRIPSAELSLAAWPQLTPEPPAVPTPEPAPLFTPEPELRTARSRAW
jgi:hypothetical protein